MSNHTRRLTALLASLSLGLGACTSLPGDGAPQVLRSYAPTVPTEDAEGPTPGQEPDLLLRDFFAASARPTGGHQAARAYLTDHAAANWNDALGTTVVDRIDINTKPGSDPSRLSYVVRGHIIGSLGTGGAFTPREGNVEETIDLVKVAGQWRIDALPAGVLLERTELRNNFSPQSLFFFDSTGRFLVSDRRWVFNRQPQLDTALLSLLMEGPKGLLAPGVETAVPQGATFTGVESGAYTFTGFGNLSPEQRHKFAAQVVWTLAKGGIVGPYSVILDGAPIDPNGGALDVDDVAEFNPTSAATAVAPLYALVDGSLQKVDGNTLTGIGNALSSSGALSSAAVSASGQLTAGVRTNNPDDNGSAELLVGPPDGALTDVLDAKTLTRPSFEFDAVALWTVSDLRTIVRIARSTTTGDMSQQVVAMPFLDEEQHQESTISELRLAPTGVRAAMIIDGHVYVGTVARPGPGERRMDNVVEVAPAIGPNALTLDWMPDGAIMVGTSDPGAPVWRVEPDGSSATPLPSGNITAPVTAVAATATTMYITDARAVLQLPVNAPTTAFWREVTSMVGILATPIVGT